MSKLFQIFQLPYSLYNHPYPYCFTLPSSHEFFGQIFENIFFLLDLLVRKLFFDKNHWFQLLSSKKDLIFSLFLISVTLHSLSVNHSIMSWRRSFGFLWKLYCYPYQVTLREKGLSVFFLSFFRFFRFCFLAYWDHYSKFAGFDSLKPSKMF